MSSNENLSPDIDDLVRTYYGSVVRLAFSILDDADEAEDAAQDAFIAAARALGDYRGMASPKTWLFTIAINTCRGRLRRRKARRTLEQALAAVQNLLGGGEPAAQRVERTERDRQLWAAVDQLDEKHRLVVILRYVHELSAAEIAGVMQITEGTVHSRLHYARQQLVGKLRRSAVFEEVA